MSIARKDPVTGKIVILPTVVPVVMQPPTPGGSAIDYSTDEQETGTTWIDGKVIYQRTWSLSAALTTTLQVIIPVADFPLTNRIIKTQYTLTDNAAAPTEWSTAEPINVRMKTDGVNAGTYGTLSTNVLTSLTLQYTKDNV